MTQTLYENKIKYVQLLNNVDDSFFVATIQMIQELYKHIMTIFFIWQKPQQMVTLNAVHFLRLQTSTANNILFE